MLFSRRVVVAAMPLTVHRSPFSGSVNHGVIAVCHCQLQMACFRHIRRIYARRDDQVGAATAAVRACILANF